MCSKNTQGGSVPPPELRTPLCYGRIIHPLFLKKSLFAKFVPRRNTFLRFVQLCAKKTRFFLCRFPHEFISYQNIFGWKSMIYFVPFLFFKNALFYKAFHSFCFFRPMQSFLSAFLFQSVFLWTTLFTKDAGFSESSHERHNTDCPIPAKQTNTCIDSTSGWRGLALTSDRWPSSLFQQARTAGWFWRIA